MTDLKQKLLDECLSAGNIVLIARLADILIDQRATLEEHKLNGHDNMCVKIISRRADSHDCSCNLEWINQALAATAAALKKIGVE